MTTSRPASDRWKGPRRPRLHEHMQLIFIFKLYVICYLVILLFGFACVIVQKLVRRVRRGDQSRPRRRKPEGLSYPEDEWDDDGRHLRIGDW
jgi:hypothetical protein